MFAAATGEGSPDTAQPLPDWLNVGANVFSAVIGVLVLLPRTRALGGVLGALSMVLSMIANYRVDGPAFFFEVLPFNVVTLVLCLALVLRLFEDLTKWRTSAERAGIVSP
ncbi:MAG: hypothetical protein AAGA54_23635 [Myxococcota bacterium]